MRRPFPWIRAALPLAIALAGCGRQPQVAPVNRDLLVSLATAVSAREPQWLERNAHLIDKKRDAGEMSEDEYRTFRSIIDRARSGDWQGAEAAAYALRDGQEPTADDLKKASERHLGDHHEMAVPKARKRR
ncbi:MAG: hypothetical protein U0800_26355 [Isosphaeraceae bacterium]